MRAPTPAHEICLFVIDDLYSTTQTTCLFAQDGRFVSNPLYKTKELVQDGIDITTFSSIPELVVYEMPNFIVSELNGVYVGVALFPRKIRASNGRFASGRRPQPKNIY